MCPATAARGVEARTPGEVSRLELGLRSGEERCLPQAFVQLASLFLNAQVSNYLNWQEIK